MTNTPVTNTPVTNTPATDTGASDTGTRETTWGVWRVVAVLALLVVAVLGATHPGLSTPAVTGPVTPPTTGPVTPGGTGSLSWPVITLAALGVLVLVIALAVVLGGRHHAPAAPARVALLPPTPWERITAVLIALLVLIVVALAVVTAWWAIFALDGVLAIAVLAWRIHRRQQENRMSEPTSPAAGLAEAVAAARSALVETAPSTHGRLGDDRAAILACYAALEWALAEQGVTRQGADTPSEHLRRATAAGLLPADAADVLLRLFHRARFSDHAISAADRAGAEHALTELSASLREAAR